MEEVVRRAFQLCNESDKFSHKNGSFVALRHLRSQRRARGQYHCRRRYATPTLNIFGLINNAKSEIKDNIVDLEKDPKALISRYRL